MPNLGWQLVLSGGEGDLDPGHQWNLIVGKSYRMVDIAEQGMGEVQGREVGNLEQGTDGMQGTDQYRFNDYLSDCCIG